MAIHAGSDKEATLNCSDKRDTAPILKIIKDAQQQHGLRHSDYQRYRGYCSRRIRRLRKVLHTTQGDRRHFKRKDINEAMLKDESVKCYKLDSADSKWRESLDKHIDEVFEVLTSLSEKNEEVTKVNDRGSALETTSLQDAINNIIIGGLPKVTDECVVDLVIKLGIELGVKVEPTDIDTAQRLQDKQSSVPSIIVKFTRRSINKHKLKHVNSTKLVNAAGHPLYVSEHLTPLNNLWFYQARKLGDDGAYKYCWVKNDKIFLRSDDNSATIRYLYIPLMMSERAWSYAMQLRQEANTEPRKKFHLVSRLRKATTYALQLQSLCESSKCDARSKLEAKAYVAWITGSLQFELQLWRPAMENLKKAQVVYEKLATALPEEDQVLYKQRVEELSPSLRYCAYNIGDDSSIDDLLELRSHGQGDLLANLDVRPPLGALLSYFVPKVDTIRSTVNLGLWDSIARDLDLCWIK
ncbi:unnamed protein product [Timema podura]|uniref:Signal recognition particle subunit SRP68 n=1 Tax=Timema podura TaxID=61482 RepID=A0ABN7NY56_TIMPD|nr:unnamed protein product [Timema podura]